MAEYRLSDAEYRFDEVVEPLVEVFVNQDFGITIRQVLRVCGEEETVEMSFSPDRMIMVAESAEHLARQIKARA